jgi:hypothetical protein
MAHGMAHPAPAAHFRNERSERTYDDVQAEVTDKQHARYGGLNIGAAFFGWVVASGIGILLASILSAGGVALAVSKLQNGVNSVSSATAQTIGIAGGIALLVALLIAYFAGGYVAGRMSRFDGARQGFGTWLFGIVIALILAAAGAIFGAKYNVLQGLNLPHIPVKAGSLTAGGVVTSIAALIVTLLASIAGGKMGERYHRKIDHAATEM